MDYIGLYIYICGLYRSIYIYVDYIGQYTYVDYIGLYYRGGF